MKICASCGRRRTAFVGITPAHLAITHALRAVCPACAGHFEGSTMGLMKRIG
jgi:hypothetical protein